jgi:hypothetical protein
MLRIIGGIVTFFLIWAIGSLWSGYVLTVLWMWFVVPTFHLPPLSVAAAIGLAIVIGYLTHQIDMNSQNKEESWDERFSKAAAYATIKPAFALFFGWIVHLFM